MQFRLMVVCAVVVLTTGCASVPRQPFNKQANTHVKKIAVVPANSPGEYLVDIVNHPGNSFGLIGAVAVAASTSSKSSEFTALQGENPRQLGPELTQAIVQALIQDGGFEVVQVPAYVPGKPRGDFLSYYDYPGVQCDAYLDVVISQAGYSAQTTSAPYVPKLSVPVRLVDAKTKQVLYTSTFFLTDGDVPSGGMRVAPDVLYRFEDFDALKAALARSAEGLKKGANTLAGHIAKDLK